MSLDLEEQEKLDELKDAWKRYGNLIVGALSIAAISYAGWQWWHHNQQQKNAEAAALYSSLQTAQKSQQNKIVTDNAKTLTEKYGSTAYAARAALIAAASNVQAQDNKTAKVELQWILDNSKEDAIKSVAALHLAQILYDENDLNGALALLNAPHDESYADLYNDLKGDILAAQNKPVDARAAYKIALEKLSADSPYRQVITIKLNAVAGVSMQ
jgi:predicted negative regulator of RcsB-dependent stress response